MFYRILYKKRNTPNTPAIIHLNLHRFKELHTEQKNFCSARIQNTTTSAPKLDLPPSPLTMGCWDAIAIRAATSPGTPHEPPDLHAPLHRVLTSFFLCHFPWIVHCVLHFQSSVDRWGPQIFHRFERTECEWLWVCLCLYVVGGFFSFLVMYNEERALASILMGFLVSVWRQPHQGDGPIQAKNPAGLSPLI